MRLRTFGGLWIEGHPESPSLRPRQLGLLALVGASGKKGVSRDRVVGILWPDAGEEQARHTLSQTLYSLRRETGTDPISGTTLLRLDPSVTSDLVELRAALATGELEQVAQLYSGGFLDGFYLPGAPEFERWAEEERAALFREVLRAVEQLARRADAEHRPADSLRFWQRLVELDPLSAHYAAGQLRALAASGDRAGALARARQYRELVRRDLNADPDPEIQRLEQSLRISVSVPSPLAPPPAAAPVASVPSGQIPSPVQISEVVPPRRVAHWLAAAALLAAVAIVLLVRQGLTGQRSNPPFLAVGAIEADLSPDSTQLGAILRDMLSTSLGGVAGLEVVANSRLVELMPRRADTLRDPLMDAARRAGATELIEGRLIREANGLTLSLRRVALSTGIVRKGYIIRAADHFALVDSATAAIARDLGRVPPSIAVTEIRTSSPAAYALYEEGLRANYGHDAPAAYRLMQAALQRDSGFAMAAYYVWQLSRNLAVDSSQAASMALAKRLATRSIERERLLIQGSIAEADAPLHKALAIAETLTVKYPGDPEGHILLGNIEERAGNWAAAGESYQRAVMLDSIAGNLQAPNCRVCTAMSGMSRAYEWWDSTPASERTVRRLVALRSKEPYLWGHLVEPLLRQGRRQDAVAAYQKAHPDTLASSRDPFFYRDDIRWGRYESVDRALREDVTRGGDELRREAWWLLMLSLRDQGRPREADSVWQTWLAADRSRGASAANQSPDILMLGVEMGRPELSFRSMRGDAERTARDSGPPGIRNRYLVWFLTLAGTAHAAAGDTAVLRRLADSVETLGQTSQFGRDAKLHYFLRGLLFQRQGRHVDAVDAFRRSLFSLTDGYTRINLMLARSLLALQRPAEAVAVLRPAIHGGVDGSNTYTSRTELHEAMAQAFEQAGQRDSALVHWRAVASAWRRADPQFAERYRHARERAGL